MRAHTTAFLALLATAITLSCAPTKRTANKPTPLPEVVAPIIQPSTGFQQRFGDEIVVAGHLYRIGAPVVTWMDPGGYDAYRVDKRFGPYEESSWEATTRSAATRRSDAAVLSPNRYNMRYTRAATRHYAPDTLDQIRGGGWSLEQLQKEVDQFVLHYDVCGTSRQCFRVLQDGRGLSVHFMLDLDGTIYQTLDVKERTWHATRSNDRSIGIEIANIGSYAVNESPAPLAEWYKKDAAGQTYITIPDRLGGPNALRTRGLTFRPARNDIVNGPIHGQTQRMYDLTPQQYDSLIKLTAALCDIFPQINCDYPRDAHGQLLTTTLTDAQWEQYKGVLGHFHIQSNKADPGPALQWDYLIDNARNLLAARKARQASSLIIGPPAPPVPPTTMASIPGLLALPTASKDTPISPPVQNSAPVRARN